MPRNYDTTSHKPYPRTTELVIRNPTDGAVRIEYVEQMAIVDGNGCVQHLEGGASRHVLDLSKIAESVPVVHPDTCAPIHGQNATQQQLRLGLLAFIHADRLRRDAEADDAAA